MNTKYHQTEGFKFPAAGLIGLDAGTKASVSKFLRARERELNTVETFSYAIEDASPAGAYSVRMSWTTVKISGKSRNVSQQIVERNPHDGNAWATDDFGDLFQIQRAENRSTDAERVTVYHPFTIYKLGRTSYTIPATIEAVERLATKLLKVKKFCSDKMISLGGQPRPAAATQPAAQVAPMATVPAAQPVVTVINTPPALLPKIEIPAKPSFDYAKLLETALKPREPVSFLTPDQIAWMDQVEILHNRVMAEQARIQNERIAQLMRDAAPPPAATCNPEAARLRAKATICRQANRPAWAKILEDKADALERVDPPEPPPCKHKRQRPPKTACILLAKIRHPVRQFLSTTQTERLTTCHAHNLNPATHQPHPYKSKQSAAIYLCQPLPNFAASTWRHGRLGKPDDTACRHPFGGSSTSYWTTPSCRTKTKLSQPGLENRGKRLDVTA